MMKNMLSISGISRAVVAVSMLMVLLSASGVAFAHDRWDNNDRDWDRNGRSSWDRDWDRNGRSNWDRDWNHKKFHKQKAWKKFDNRRYRAGYNPHRPYFVNRMQQARVNNFWYDRNRRGW